MLPTEVNSNESNSSWQTLLDNIPPNHRQTFVDYEIDDQRRLIIYLAPDANLEWIENRLDVEAAVKIGFGDCLYTLEKIAASYWIEKDEPPNDNHENDPDDYQGVYHNSEDAIIQPKNLEYNQATQYYRRKWRPLLGPTLSELIRELRQRCHYKSKRDKFQTTYKSLASTLGVSEATIKRSLARDKNGQFKNEYLRYFIADIQVIRESNGRGAIRTKGTRFLIYLTDTLTPEDRKKTEDLRK